MFQYSFNLENALSERQIPLNGVLSVKVRVDEIVVAIADDSVYIPLEPQGNYMVVPPNSIHLYPNLRNITYYFSNTNVTKEAWSAKLGNAYKNCKCNFSLDLVDGDKLYNHTIIVEELAPVEIVDDQYEDEEFEDEEYEDDQYEDEDEDDQYEDEDEDDKEPTPTPVGVATVSTAPVDLQLQEFSDKVVSNIVNALEGLYSDCYIQRPYGVLTSSGIMYFNENTRRIELLNAGTDLYAVGAFQEYCGKCPSIKQLNGMNLKQVVGPKGLLYNYMPVLQTEIAFGLIKDDATGQVIGQESNWGKYLDYLKIRLRGVVTVLLKAKGGKFDVNFQRQIVEILTNTFIVKEYNIDKAIHVRYKMPKAEVLFAKFLEKEGADFFLAGNAKVLSEDSSKEIKRVLYAFDENTYASEILFAYKMYQKLVASGVKPTAQTLVVGRTLDGKDMILNLGAKTDTIGCIMAGPRSGKGVLTLSVLAGLLAHEVGGRTIPFLYLDGKPEMAETLWEMERELNRLHPDKEYKILAIEGKNQQSMAGIGPTRGCKTLSNGSTVVDFGRGLPEGLVGAINTTNVIPYLKLMQLFSAMAKANLPGVLPYTNRFDRVMMILDETIAIKGDYQKFCQEIQDYAKANKPKGNNEPTEEFLACQKMLKALTHITLDNVGNGQITNDLVGVLMSEGPKQGFGVIQIGQFTTPEMWKTAGVRPPGWESNPFGFMMKNATWRILGKNSGQSNEYGLAELKADGMSLVGKLEKGESPDEDKGQLGHFVYLNGATKDAGIQKVFKSYLALNENDFNPQDPDRSGIFTSQLLGNIRSANEKNLMIRDDLLREDGSVREEIGFMGLAKMLMSDPTQLAERLCSGYNLVWEFMCANGLSDRYSCVEDYLVDCSPSSIFTVDNLAKGVDFGPIEEEMTIDPETGELTGGNGGGNLDMAMGMGDSIVATPLSERRAPTGAPAPNPGFTGGTGSPGGGGGSPFASTGSQPQQSTTPQFNIPNGGASGGVNSQPVQPKINKEMTVKDLLGAEKYKMNMQYLQRLPSSRTPQPSIRSREIQCFKPFTPMDVKRAEPLSAVLIPPFLNVRCVTDKMCKSRFFSGIGRALKRQDFYQTNLNKHETNTMLLSIGNMTGGLDMITHIDIVNGSLMFNNIDFNYSGEITLDTFHIPSFKKFYNLMVLGVDTPVNLGRVLKGMKMNSIDSMWLYYDSLLEIECMGMAYTRGGEEPLDDSIFDEPEKVEEEVKLDMEKPEEAEDDLDMLPELDKEDSEKIQLLTDKLKELCLRKYGKELPIEITELPNIDYHNSKEIQAEAVKQIIAFIQKSKKG